jgi:hypothetical protein
MSKIYTIEQKMSGTGTIHDIASDLYDRDVEFGDEDKYAVVTAAYYGGKGYTTHETDDDAIAAARDLDGCSYEIIDEFGSTYAINGDRLCDI